jgi:hypothetical protein
MKSRSDPDAWLRAPQPTEALCLLFHGICCPNPRCGFERCVCEKLSETDPGCGVRVCLRMSLADIGEAVPK